MSSFQFPNNPFNRPNATGGPAKRRGPLPFTILTLVVLAVILVASSGFYADLLWFRSVNFTSVWRTVLFTKSELFIGFGLITSLVITANVVIAFRKRPIYVPISIEADNLERYRAQLEPIRRFAVLGIAVVLFYFAGTSGTRLWE